MDSSVKNILMTPQLNMFEKLVYIAISTQIGKTGQVSISVKTIASLSSCSENSVRRALAGLSRFGLVRRTAQIAVDGGQLANMYTVAVKRLPQGRQKPCKG